MQNLEVVYRLYFPDTLSELQKILSESKGTISWSGAEVFVHRDYEGSVLIGHFWDSISIDFSSQRHPSRDVRVLSVKIERELVRLASETNKLFHRSECSSIPWWIDCCCCSCGVSGEHLKSLRHPRQSNFLSLKARQFLSEDVKKCFPNTTEESLRQMQGKILTVSEEAMSALEAAYDLENRIKKGTYATFTQIDPDTHQPKGDTMYYPLDTQES